MDKPKAYLPETLQDAMLNCLLQVLVTLGDIY